MTARKPVFSNRTDRFRAIIRHVPLFFPPWGAYGERRRKGWRGRSVIRYDDGCAKGCIARRENERGRGGRAKGFFFRDGQSNANLECVRPIIEALGAFVVVGRGSCVLRGTISLRHSDIRSVSVLGRGFLASPALGSCIGIFPVQIGTDSEGCFNYFSLTYSLIN